jgi:hypothetical protein
LSGDARLERIKVDAIKLIAVRRGNDALEVSKVRG